ncbi:MAG: bifunctional methionine sulfoxide reductase B/A protein [Phycisphaerales bacterium]|nr:MAG: bifunctional methionine sulfoxide reductase B/A protein [Phycisphaerales bacterium]
MKCIKRKIATWFLLFSLVTAAVLSGAAQKRPEHTTEVIQGKLKTTLIDDFSYVGSDKKASAKWRLIDDLLLGGASTGRIEFGEYDGRQCLHMTGSVSGRKNGGFIQARLSLLSRRKSFDAGKYKGITLRTKGNGQSYAVLLQTKDTRLRWQNYQAVFATSGKWQDVMIPFAKFKSASLRKPLDTTSIRSVAIAASGKGLDADIFLDEIAFYGDGNMYKKLTPEEERVIIHKGTERPFTGKYDKHYEKGVYTCKQCGAELYESSSKFDSGCGWPAFDDELPGAIRRLPDRDGIRTEITCAKCGGHLGHVFSGERMTAKNVRHCVNSISLDFVPAKETKTERAIFASGCFWGTEYHLKRAPGVISTTVGYTGGHVPNPTYKQVCTDKTGHAEAVEVIYDPTKTTYEKLARLFFETHDFTQLNRQGPDIGKQYRSAVFYLDEEQKKVALSLIKTLKDKGFAVKTQVTKAAKFWPAELSHQDYYQKTGKQPYCHVYRKIF